MVVVVTVGAVVDGGAVAAAGAGLDAVEGVIAPDEVRGVAAPWQKRL